MVRSRTIAALLALALAGCMASPDDVATPDDDPSGDSVGVEAAGSIGVRVPASLNLTERGKFYVTFDDGPSSAYTPRVLATLRAHHVPATFFVTGANIAGNEDVIRDELAQGHHVANHQWSHVIASVAQFRAWVPREADALDAAARQRLPRLFRYPYGAGSAEKETILHSFGYAVGGIGWDVDTLDWCFGSAGRCDRASAQYRTNYVEWVVSEARRVGHGVMLFHDIQGVTARNLDAILTRMEALGFTFGAIPASAAAPAPTPTVTSCTVSVDAANVRSSPATSASNVVATVTRGTAVAVRGMSGDWYSVRVAYQGRDLGTDAAPAYMHRSVLACR